MLAFCISCACTAWLARDLAKKGQLDRPIFRSSHTFPTPRGAGLAIMGSFVPCAALLGMDLLTLIMLVLLIAVSWLDDLYPLNWQVRLIAQCFAVGFSLAALWQSGLASLFYARFFPIPLVLFAGALGLAWLWHLNLTNFMDGIDGYVAAQTILITFACGAYFLIVKGDENHALLTLVLGGATFGFFVWNYPPAHIFLGEVGSIPLGFLTGFFLLLLFEKGGWGFALSLPLWFWLDASVTLLCRLLKGKSAVQAHREHFYQRAAGQTPAGHKRVLNFYILMQVSNYAALAAAFTVLPSQQWLLPLISVAFGAIYFYRLSRFARQQA
jgi:UDP-N-acetylmuramyl pentapeptide phosphotransferase/UDP-N-acetylglucosamine-1-phosphate transferase